MPRATPGYRTYLVEQYQPGLTQAQLEDSAASIRLAASRLAGAGRRVRYRSSTIVPEDECLLSTIRADSESLVREVFTHAGLRIDRLSVVVPVQAGPHRSPGDARSVTEQCRPDGRADATPSSSVRRTRARKETS